MRITSFEDAAVANKEVLNKITALENRLQAVRNDFDRLHTKYVNTLDNARNSHTTNNLIFTWTGGPNTLTWPAGNIQDTLKKTEVITTGSLTLSASTYYWLLWNRTHKKVVAVRGLTEDLFTNNANHILCQIFTGTSGQSGVAGGGGSTSQRDLSGARYKNF
jgi:hypothetical protein